ncbi:MAG: desulfoferrodoxin family protein [Bacilli bacterium]
MKFYLCNHCKNLVEMVKDSGVNPSCCGELMTELVPGTSDGAVEKHLPVVNVEGNNVTVVVGSVDHPMVDVHYIEWIVVETTKGVLRHNLLPGDAPRAEFLLSEGEKVIATYAYCNLHGLWKA